MPRGPSGVRFALVFVLGALQGCLAARLRSASGLPKESSSAVRITGEEKELSKGLLKAIELSSLKAGVRGGPLPQVVDDHDPDTTSLLHQKEPTEMLEAWKNKGLATVQEVSWSKEAQSALDNSFTTAAYEKVLKDFVASADSRFIFNPGNEKARNFVKANLESSLGKQQGAVTMEEFDLAFGDHQGKGVNVIGRLEGRDRPDEYVVLGAHYDSVPYTGPAPGADDNGSGVAALLLAAEALAKFPHERTILFVSFSGEEEGLLGSRAFVQDRVLKDAKNFKGAIVMDQIGFQKDPKGPASVIFETKGNDDPKQAIVDTMALTTQAVVPRAEFKVNYHGWGSDHVPFLDQGLPAVLLIERDNLYSADNFGHTPKDTLANVDYSFGAKVAKIAAASIANMASPKTKKI